MRVGEVIPGKANNAEKGSLGRVGYAPGLCSGLNFGCMTGAATGEVCRGHVLRGF